MILNRPFLLFCLAVVLFSCGKKQEKKALEESKNIDKIWYNQPATSWMTEALPIGNGYMGAMFFGGVDEERIQFNEETLWSGGKGEWDGYNGGNREGAYKYLPEVRRLLNEGKFDEAHQLANKELSGVIKASTKEGWVGFGAYQAFGDVYVKTDHQGEKKNYRRQLNISDAIGSVDYEVGSVTYHCEYFASYPKRTIVLRFENNNPDGSDYEVRQTSLHKNLDVVFKDNQLIVSGNLANNGMGFESRMLVESVGGEINFSDGKLFVKASKKLTLYLTAATDYQNEYPSYTGRDYEALNKKSIASVKSASYSDLLNEHKRDYSSLYSRVNFQLGNAKNDAIPTDERLKAYASGKPDPSLEALYFQYGRYLMISSSRPGTLPANLQGKWNNKTNPPWASDYHANINIQMIYWPVEVTNLSECHLPLIEYIDKLRDPGRKTAQEFFNTRGWVVNTMNNTFGFTAPGWSFPWGFFPGGAAWYGRHIWEHYDFTGDKDFLQNKGYPIMKEAALFWLDYLTKDQEGHLVSSPSYSPEQGGISTGAYMDIEIAWDIFNNCIKACEVLDTDDAFKQQLIGARDNLLPLRIGKWGQLQEWKEDRDDPDNKHRHVSHLYALHPGNQISVADTPELAEAAKVSLKGRGDDGTGWSIAWKINFWSRLLDGNHAYKLLKRAMQLTSDDGVNMMDGGGVYTNLFSTHPPFQLDGNMGATAGMAEMLVQSHTGTIHILPALPDAWLSGKITGLKARGGFTVDIEWENGKLINLLVTSAYDTKAMIKYGVNMVEGNFSKGKSIQFDGSLKIIE
ncbi:glycoside hydrolase N-terminal domain-containing protein [Reichenbachiella sp. MALMAid0571]|uniref:glycoside hydrolase family 95 protein n=1 Tax=Reichenbachiella sp. MALMAid0571 TaxID=3143939 RepID=UPI0032DFD704